MQPDYSVNAATLVTGVVSMKLGFVCLNLPGHLDPMTALARQLQARNHDVVFCYSPGAARRTRNGA
jgi:UDP:flavonoid glycosyltransferase YjiC (YdhE family)